MFDLKATPATTDAERHEEWINTIGHDDVHNNYMSMEQHMAEERQRVDSRPPSDVFAPGVRMWDVFVGNAALSVSQYKATMAAFSGKPTEAMGICSGEGVVVWGKHTGETVWRAYRYAAYTYKGPYARNEIAYLRLTDEEVDFLVRRKLFHVYVDDKPKPGADTDEDED